MKIRKVKKHKKIEPKKIYYFTKKTIWNRYGNRRALIIRI